MALVVFLRGINVGGHRTFRPSALSRKLTQFDVVNIGAAGTFVVRKNVARTKLVAEIRKSLPFETKVMVCDGRDLLRLETDHPFGIGPTRQDIVRFVSVLSKNCKTCLRLPITLPAAGPWSLRILAVKGRFAFGEYRRQMKAIGYLGKIDTLLGASATTRNWNTLLSIIRVLKDRSQGN